jgi:hypothetical protein
MRKQTLEKIRKAIEDGYEISQIASQFDLDPTEVDAAAREILESIAKRFRDTPREVVFAEMLLVAVGHMRRLHNIAEKKDTQPRDAIAAIKTSWGIRTKVMDEARRCGAVSDGPDKIAGIDVSFISNMSSEEIRHALLTIPDKVKRLERDYQDMDIMSVDAGPMFGVADQLKN